MVQEDATKYMECGGNKWRLRLTGKQMQLYFEKLHYILGTEDIYDKI
jgi:hypothetical protein